MKRFELWVLLGLLLLGFIVRLYRFDNPIADWHSWRQADTSAVSRNFIKRGFDLLHPRYDDLSRTQTGRSNPEGYRFVEFPIYNFFQAGLFKLFDYFTLEGWGRLVSIFSSLSSAVFIYLLVKKYLNLQIGLLAAFFFLFLPFSIYYSRTILPDETMVTAILGGIYFFDRWIEKSSKFKVQSEKLQFEVKNYFFYFLAVLLTASALLLKPFALFFALPMIYLAWKHLGTGFVKKRELWLFLILSILPLVFWRMWMLQYPEGIPTSGWLLNGGDIRFKGAFFYWIFAERISKLILGYFGVVLLIFGLFKKEGEKDYLFFLSFLVSALAYLFVFARGNVQHDYYQILIIPTVAIFLSRGAAFLLSFKTSPNKTVSYLVLPILILFMLAFSWYIVRDYFNINNRSIVEAGKKADELLPKDAIIIAPYGGDTAFLYQTNRRGWPVFTRSIQELIQMGASYLVIANPTKSDFDGFGRWYQIIASSPTYLIIKLK